MYLHLNLNVCTFTISLPSIAGVAPTLPQELSLLLPLRPLSSQHPQASHCHCCSGRHGAHQVKNCSPVTIHFTIWFCKQVFHRSCVKTIFSLSAGPVARCSTVWKVWAPMLRGERCWRRNCPLPSTTLTGSSPSSPRSACTSVYGLHLYMYIIDKPL